MIRRLLLAQATAVALLLALSGTTAFASDGADDPEDSDGGSSDDSGDSADDSSDGGDDSGDDSSDSSDGSDDGGEDSGDSGDSGGSGSGGSSTGSDSGGNTGSGDGTSSGSDDGGSDDGGEDSGGAEDSGSGSNGARSDDDHEEARRAVDANDALPLGVVLARFKSYGDFTIIDVKLARSNRNLLYVFKYIDPSGTVKKAYFDAKSGERVK